MANIKWAKDRALRQRLAEMEMERRRRFIIIVRDTGTGEEKAFSWDDTTAWRVRAFIERDAER